MTKRLVVEEKKDQASHSVWTSIVQIVQTTVSYKNKHTVLEARKSKIKGLADMVSGKGPLPSS